MDILSQNLIWKKHIFMIHHQYHFTSSIELFSFFFAPSIHICSHNFQHVRGACIWAHTHSDAFIGTYSTKQTNIHIHISFKLDLKINTQCQIFFFGFSKTHIHWLEHSDRINHLKRDLERFERVIHSIFKSSFPP